MNIKKISRMLQYNDDVLLKWQYTVKPVCNDHLQNELYNMWFTQ